MGWVGSRDSIDGDVGGEILEHGTGFAGLEVESQLTVEFIGVHSLEGGEELISIEVLVWESNQTWGTVVREVDEDFIIGS